MSALALRKLPPCFPVAQFLAKSLNAQFNTSSTSCAKLEVDFYFDTVSPYTWPAFEVLNRYRERWDLAIHYKPVFLGGLTAAASNPHLNTMATCPNKAAYNFMDLGTRTAEFFNIPFRMKADPFNLIGVVGSLQQQRFVSAVLQNNPEHMERVLRSFWMRSWSEDKDVHTAEDITAVGRSAGMEEDEIAHCLAAMKTDSVKTALKAMTAEAVERGAFGAPTMFFHEDGEKEEMFWGSDRFEMVASRYGKQWMGPDPAK